MTDQTTDQTWPTTSVRTTGPDGGPPLGRRSVLAVGGLVAGGATLLAACGGGSTGSATAAGPATAATGSGGSAAATTPAAAASDAELAKLSAIPVGTAVAATLAGAPVVVAQPKAGEAVAFSAVCTHMGCTVAPAGAKAGSTLPRLGLRRAHRQGAVGPGAERAARRRGDGEGRRGGRRRRLMPVTVLGLPVHALVLHATVVLLPLTAALLVLCAFSAQVSRRAGLLLPAAGIVALVLVPVTVSSGKALRGRLPLNPQIEAHARAGNALLPWVIGLAVMCLVAWAVRWRAARGGGRLAARSAASVALAALAVVAAMGTVVEVGYIGHLGATATWSYVDRLPPRPTG